MCHPPQHSSIVTAYLALKSWEGAEMSANFSGAVRLADLASDFIAPSQACVVSLTGDKLESDALAPTEVGICGLQYL